MFVCCLFVLWCPRVVFSDILCALCTIGTGRLAVLESCLHYRGRLQCFDAILVLFGAKMF